MVWCAGVASGGQIGTGVRGWSARFVRFEDIVGHTYSWVVVFLQKMRGVRLWFGNKVGWNSFCEVVKISSPPNRGFRHHVRRLGGLRWQHVVRVRQGAATPKNAVRSRASGIIRFQRQGSRLQDPSLTLITKLPPTTDPSAIRIIRRHGHCPPSWALSFAGTTPIQPLLACHHDHPEINDCNLPQQRPLAVLAPVGRHHVTMSIAGSREHLSPPVAGPRLRLLRPR